MKKSIAWIMGSVILASCVYLLWPESNKSSMPYDTGDVEQLVHDYSVGKLSAKSASITARELIITEENDQQYRVELPQDIFFVSIAPYVEDTHECAVHSLTGCRGEMPEQAFEVLVEDEQGQVVVEDTLVSGANGFIDLWLPRDRLYSIKIIGSDGKSQDNTLSTYDADKTCITTIQLM